MPFYVAFHDAEVLEEARARSIAGHFPHLRLVSLVPATNADALPIHVRRVVLEPSEELLDGGIHALLSADPAATAARYPQVARSDIVTWDELPGAYNRWLEEHYLPSNAHLSTFTPDGLTPLGFSRERLTVELIGSCGAVFLERAAQQMPAELDCFHTVQNHPIASPPERTPTLRIVVPPLRYMHPATLDDFVSHPDHERLFEETRRHTLAYLDSVADAAPGVPLFVLGFIEPHMNPAGLFFHAREKSNFKHFVRCLNDVMVDWCEGRSFAHFVDGDGLAAAVGKIGVDESTQTYLSHRGPLDPEYDDCTDALWAFQPPPVARSYDVRSSAYSLAILREVVQRHLILRGVGRVKAVIVDLDNTVWRGLASDGVVGPWAGRPQGIVEALKVLKSRGIYLAIASKNDEGYIREQWNINGRRIEEAEFRGGRLFIADVRDAGNSYGIVGAALVQDGLVTHLVISCRVIGMGIDDAFVQQLVSRCGELKLAYEDSGKNRGTKAFIDRHAPDGALDLSAVAAPSHVSIEGPAEPLAPAA